MEGNGRTLLYMACKNGCVGVPARLLLDKGAEVDRAKEKWSTPLYIACKKGQVDAARLLDKGAEVDRLSRRFDRLPNGGSSTRRLEVLLDKGAMVDRAAEGRARVTPLHSSPARRARSTWCSCCWTGRGCQPGAEGGCDAAVHRLPERPRRRGAAFIG